MYVKVVIRYLTCSFRLVSSSSDYWVLKLSNKKSPLQILSAETSTELMLDTKGLSHLPSDKFDISITFLSTSDDEFGANLGLQHYSHQKTHKSGSMVVYLYIF